MSKNNIHWNTFTRASTHTPTNIQLNVTRKHWHSTPLERQTESKREEKRERAENQCYGFFSYDVDDSMVHSNVCTTQYCVYMERFTRVTSTNGTFYVYMDWLSCAGERACMCIGIYALLFVVFVSNISFVSLPLMPHCHWLKFLEQKIFTRWRWCVNINIDCTWIMRDFDGIFTKICSF